MTDATKALLHALLDQQIEMLETCNPNMDAGEDKDDLKGNLLLELYRA